jgi:hypothetical protein
MRDCGPQTQRCSRAYDPRRAARRSPAAAFSAARAFAAQPAAAASGKPAAAI